MNRHGQRHNRKRVKRMRKVYICSPYRAKDGAELDRNIDYASSDTAGVRGGLSTHYAAFIYDAVHGR